MGPATGETGDHDRRCVVAGGTPGNAVGLCGSGRRQPDHHMDLLRPRDRCRFHLPHSGRTLGSQPGRRLHRRDRRRRHRRSRRVRRCNDSGRLPAGSRNRRLRSGAHRAGRRCRADHVASGHFGLSGHAHRDPVDLPGQVVTTIFFGTALILTESEGPARTYGVNTTLTADLHSQPPGIAFQETYDFGFDVPCVAQNDPPPDFTDYNHSAFEKDIAWLASTGITRGCSDTAFCPDGPVTCDQMAAFLRRALDR